VRWDLGAPGWIFGQIEGWSVVWAMRRA